MLVAVSALESCEGPLRARRSDALWKNGPTQARNSLPVAGLRAWHQATASDARNHAKSDRRRPLTGQRRTNQFIGALGSISFHATATYPLQRAFMSASSKWKW